MESEDYAAQRDLKTAEEGRGAGMSEKMFMFAGLGLLAARYEPVDEALVAHIFGELVVTDFIAACVPQPNGRRRIWLVCLPIHYKRFDADNDVF
jgi:hypothetical protein